METNEVNEVAETEVAEPLNDNVSEQVENTDIKENTEPTDDIVEDEATEETSKTFTQADVDKIIKDRLTREKKSYETELQKYKSSPALTFVEKQAKKYDMSVDDYLQAVEVEEQRAEIAKIAEDEGVSETVAKKLYNATKLEESTKLQAQKNKETEIRNKHLSEFVEKFPDVKELPKEVWDVYNKGNVSLVDAYKSFSTQDEIKSLKSQLAEYKEKLGIKETNNNNATASTGSVTGNGNTSSLLTREQVKNMTREEVNKNYSKIIESQKSW